METGWKCHKHKEHESYNMMTNHAYCGLRYNPKYCRVPIIQKTQFSIMQANVM